MTTYESIKVAAAVIAAMATWLLLCWLSDKLEDYIKTKKKEIREMNHLIKMLFAILERNEKLKRNNRYLKRRNNRLLQTNKALEAKNKRLNEKLGLVAVQLLNDPRKLDAILDERSN